jgi:hypothetical protein
MVVIRTYMPSISLRPFRSYSALQLSMDLEGSDPAESELLNSPRPNQFIPAAHLSWDTGAGAPKCRRDFLSRSVSFDDQFSFSDRMAFLPK